jgi:hypothetical protein
MEAMKTVVTPKSDRARKRNNWIVLTLAVAVALGLYAAILMRAAGVGVWAQ